MKSSAGSVASIENVRGDEAPYIVNGCYELLELVGCGSSGSVYKGKDLRTGRTVAVKALPSSVRSDEVAARRIHREIRIAFGISHPNVVRLLDCSIDEHLVCLILEWISGKTLRDYVQACGEIRLSEAISILTQIASALTAIHHESIVHRDVKPENVLISDDGRVYLTDFGISRSAELNVDEIVTENSPGMLQRVTNQGGVVGTPHYVSPEYISAGECTVLSDVYSLGVLAYELVAGRLPFDAESLPLLYRAITEDQPVPVSDVNPACPEWFESLIMRCLEKGSEDRPTSARAVCDVLKSKRSGIEHDAFCIGCSEPGIETTLETYFLCSVLDKIESAVLMLRRQLRDRISLRLRFRDLLVYAGCVLLIVTICQNFNAASFGSIKLNRKGKHSKAFDRSQLPDGYRIIYAQEVNEPEF